MNLIQIGEHTIDADRDLYMVLDVGCRGFTFGDGIRKLVPSALIVEVDVEALWESSRPYIRAAIMGENGWVRVSDTKDPNARHAIKDSAGVVPAYTVETITDLFKIPTGWWDVIKLDCEGAEFEILKGFDRPWARQITVEFHQHLQHAKRTDAELDGLIEHLSQWYDVVQHVKDERYGCGLNYWDSLLVRKK